MWPGPGYTRISVLLLYLLVMYIWPAQLYPRLPYLPHQFTIAWATSYHSMSNHSFAIFSTNWKILAFLRFLRIYASCDKSAKLQGRRIIKRCSAIIQSLYKSREFADFLIFCGFWPISMWPHFFDIVLGTLLTEPLTHPDWLWDRTLLYLANFRW
jgi:hypothetical protein